MVRHRRIRDIDLVGMRIKGEEEVYRSFGMGRESRGGCTGKQKTQGFWLQTVPEV